MIEDFSMPDIQTEILTQAMTARAAWLEEELGNLMAEGWTPGMIRIVESAPGRTTLLAGGVERAEYNLKFTCGGRDMTETMLPSRYQSRTSDNPASDSIRRAPLPDGSFSRV